MTYRAFTATLMALAITPMLALDSNAQIFTTRSDLESEFRVQWLQMKRDLPQDIRPGVQRYAQCITNAIVAQIPEEFQNLDWEVIVFDSDQRNALVTMFGKVAVFSGILELADTPDKLAAVIGHEVSHLTENHVTERVNRGRLTTIASAFGRATTGIDSSGAAAVALQLPFQRGQEIEADISGMTYMARAGYNPASALALWRSMFEESGEQSSWLSTHPDPELRMEDIAKNLAPALVEYNTALDAGVRPACSLAP